MKRALKAAALLWPLSISTSLHLMLLAMAATVTYSVVAVDDTHEATIIPLSARVERCVMLERPRDIFERKGLPQVGDLSSYDPALGQYFLESDHNESGDPESFNGQGFGRGRGSGVYDAAGIGGGGGGRRNLKRIAAGADRPAATAPEPAPTAETYAHREENDFKRVADQPLSTFSIDVDTSSYSNIRRFILNGQLPPRDAVRIEEMLNYFRYDYAAPADGKPFSAAVESHAAPWSPRHRLVRIGLRARDVDFSLAPAANLVFLVDVSGSMEQANKLPLVKQSLRMLVKRMRSQDKVALVTYAGTTGIALRSTSGADKSTIETAIQRMAADGSTNGAAGIQLAYEVAQANFVKGGINRVILCTDGDWNVGVTSDADLGTLIAEKRSTGVFLSVLGYGMGNYQDAKAQELAEKGNGNAAYIDSVEEAHKVLVRQMTGTLLTVAKDVKIQVEFNPAKVAGYRLVGYESRMLAARDFNDDRKDAGEMGAGHQVTALYEIVPVGVEDGSIAVDPLKYQKPGIAKESPELLTVKLRYKEPESDVSEKFEVPFVERQSQPSEDFDFATAVAMSGMLLRGSALREGANWGLVVELAKGGLGNDPAGDRAEFVSLMERAGKLSVK